jgi:hypothetical protein
MPEQSSQEFKIEALEADIKRLSEEIQKHREMPENKVLGGQELVKKSIQAMVSTPPSTAQAVQQSGGALPDYAAGASAESKLEIEHLVDIAFNQGIDKANAQAMKSSPFIMDAFHDAMAAKLYPELQKRGILK